MPFLRCSAKLHCSLCQPESGCWLLLFFRLPAATTSGSAARCNTAGKWSEEQNPAGHKSTMHNTNKARESTAGRAATAAACTACNFEQVGAPTQPGPPKPVRPGENY